MRVPAGDRGRRCGSAAARYQFNIPAKAPGCSQADRYCEKLASVNIPGRAVFRIIQSALESEVLPHSSYLPHLPAAGEIVIFDRSWYNRAGVERVMGFCTEEEVKSFLSVTPRVERAIVGSGVILLKYWLEVSPEEQTRLIEARIDDPRKIWKLSPMDLKSYSRWFDYSRARDEMFAATDTEWAPWFAVRSDDKKRTRLNIISLILASIPYEEMPRENIKLPKRQKAEGYEEPAFARNWVPEAH
jgi:hypothetical protein